MVLGVKVILLIRGGTKRLEVLALDSLVLESFSEVGVDRRFRIFEGVALEVEVFKKNRSYNKEVILWSYIYRLGRNRTLSRSISNSTLYLFIYGFSSIRSYCLRGAISME